MTVEPPAVQRVQLLVDGKEVDTIAGHVDVRRPLERDTTLVREAGAVIRASTTENSRLKTQKVSTVFC